MTIIGIWLKVGAVDDDDMANPYKLTEVLEEDEASELTSIKIESLLGNKNNIQKSSTYDPIDIKVR